MRTGSRRAPSAPAGPSARGAAPYSIVIPPPNVTGSLHMGHALNNTLQDILARFERMRGKDVLWQPGTDHAGIATQMVVERQLMERQEPGRRDMGREKFLERVWAWKAESGGTIINQLKRLGASCDWSRERFTMDEGLSRAVLKVFVELYNEGLIYKDKRLVNWDPKLLTAISDLEVQQVEVKGPPLALQVSDRRRSRTKFIIGRDDAAGDDAGRHRGRGASRRRALQAPDRQARDPAAGRPPHSDRRRRICRSGEGHRRGEDHAGARLQRLRGRQAARSAADQRARCRRQARARATTRRSSTACRRRPSSTRRSTLHGLDRFEARKTIVERLEDGGLARQDRAAHAHGAARRPLQRGDRAVPHRPVVRQRQGAGGRRRSPRCARARPASCRRTGRRPISTGWRTSSRGASRASSGGATRSRRGTGRTARSSSPRPRTRRLAERSPITRETGAISDDQARQDGDACRTSARRSSRATRTCSTPGSPRRCGRSRRSAGRTRRRN